MRQFSHFFYGVVTIEISGLIPEKLINLCMAHGIFLWGIVKCGANLRASLHVAEFFRIRPLVRKSQCRIRVLSGRGLPFIMKRLKRRKMLWVGAGIFIILLHYLTSYIWFVEITGMKTIDRNKILAVATENGLRQGMPKQQLNIKDTEKAIMISIPELAWVGINCQGTRVVVEVVEKTIAKEADRAPAHIAAAKDGIITEVIALVGEPLVERGNTVKRGDILIKGIVAGQTTGDQNIPAQPTNEVRVRAKGIVKARVWYEGYGEARLVEDIAERSGRQVMSVIAKLGQWEVPFQKVAPRPFEHFEIETIQKKFPNWRNSVLTVESNINIYHELLPRRITRTQEAAHEIAKAKALVSIRRHIPETAQILAHDITVLQTAEPDLIRVKVNVESIEDIGEPKAIIP